jgi:hypothetical protein
MDVHGIYATPFDDHGHGTQTMGIMVGGDIGGTAIGMAPGAQWIAARIFDNSGQASLSDIHQGFDWILDPDGNTETDDAPDVVNNSWVFPTLVGQCYLEFADVIQVLKTAGISVMFSAGNEGPFANTSVSPSNNPGSFAVGAVDQNSLIAGFSSRGPSACDGNFFPHVVAPGVLVRTSDNYSTPENPRYSSVSGTSFAAPHVAGGMALLMEAFPGVSVHNLESAIEQSAYNLGEPGEDNSYGSGLLDVMEVYNMLNALTVQVQVAADSDDAEERASGSMKLTSSDLELVYDKGGNQHVGMRFNVDIPKDANIYNAYIQFTADETHSVPTSLVIQGEDIGDAMPFESNDRNISLRDKTAASVSWDSIPDWAAGDAGPYQMTPDISPVIQEIVRHPDWSPNNWLAIIITGTGERVAESYDGLPSGAPVLNVEYSAYIGEVYNYYCDGDGDFHISTAISETCTGAGCTVPAGCDISPGDDCDDEDANNYPGNTEACDGQDNDCDAGTPDGSGDPAPPLNSNQEGVCAGSTQSCNEGTWQDDYSTVLDYEPTEVTCDDMKDNDCDGLEDIDPECTETTTIWVPVTSGDDDAEELLESGKMDLSSSDLEMVEENSTQTVGMRFTINIPQGANIINAYIEFTVDEADDVATTLLIEGQDDDNGPTFSSTDGDISSRTNRTAGKTWDPSSWTTVGAKKQTPDISSIIQAIVNRTNWTDSIVIFITGTGKRVAESYDGAAPPVLHVEYSVYVPDVHNYYCDDDSDGFISSTVSETCTGAGCTLPTGCVEVAGDDCDDTDYFINPDATEFCDGLDNDCDTGTEDGSGDPAPPPNSNQAGVCANSKQSCNGGTWEDDYSTIPFYEPAEVTCNDLKDNDCDGEADTDPECTETTTIWVPVAESSDDAEERPSGSMKLSSSDLEMVFDRGGNQHIGMRFQVDIPKDAHILNAYIQFTADESHSGPTTLTIEGEDTGNAPAFIEIDGNISSRTARTTSVLWPSITEWIHGDAGPVQMTPDISPIIQEIVSNPGWAANNSLVIIITGTGERVAESYDGSAAPVLHVEYSP